MCKECVALRAELIEKGKIVLGWVPVYLDLEALRELTPDKAEVIEVGKD